MRRGAVAKNKNGGCSVPPPELREYHQKRSSETVFTSRGRIKPITSTTSHYVVASDPSATSYNTSILAGFCIPGKTTTTTEKKMQGLRTFTKQRGGGGGVPAGKTAGNKHALKLHSSQAPDTRRHTRSAPTHPSAQGTSPSSTHISTRRETKSKRERDKSLVWKKIRTIQM